MGDLNKEAKILIDLASYRAMPHTNDAQTVHTCQTRSVCKPRPPAYIQGPACIQGPASISTITSDPPACIRGPKFGGIATAGLYLRPGFYSRKYGMLCYVIYRISSSSKVNLKPDRITENAQAVT